ncbi:MAG: DUF523 domain-containing protein [Rhodopirellula sp.]|nr:DUF523 domain-containing protein [Rhodopirellula sp.]
MPTERVLVSKCLLGQACAYDGTAAERQLEPALIESMRLDVLAVCPEELGGLPTPRPRIELVGGDGNDVISGTARAVNKHGDDRTRAMLQGAQATSHLARKHCAVRMIARRRSPSCSCNQVADGSFMGNFRPGPGVAVALLRAELGLPCVKVEEIVVELLKGALRQGIDVYHSLGEWSERRDRVVALLSNTLPLEKPAVWSEFFRAAFREVIQEMHQTRQASDDINLWDSDTVRFFQDSCRQAFGIELIVPSRRCRICTYPEGFLDSYLDGDGVCSACRSYQQHQALLVDYPRLRIMLRRKINEVRGRFPRECVAACSGGKDSTYMLYRLRREFGADVVCVVDELNQQNLEAVDNLRRACRQVDVDLVHLDAPPDVRGIRRNFLLRGNSFCRLCLRSHLIRVYHYARDSRIPLVFFGLSPYQCLDCADAIRWSIQAINDVATPQEQLDHGGILERYRHRAFQGGFDTGFITPGQRTLYAEWQQVFRRSSADFAPLLVPFFLFDGYPDEEEVMSTIASEVGWIKPEVLLNRTNCRMLRLAGIIHRAIGRYHLNYKERATRLRFAGRIMSEDEAHNRGEELDQAESREAMSRQELEHALQQEFALSIDDLPEHVQQALQEILT